jgi:hypothetical protein
MIKELIISLSICFGVVLGYGVIRLAVAYFEHKYRNHEK